MEIRGEIFDMNTRETKMQELKRYIEESREKLNLLVNQNSSDITVDIMDASQKLDTLINEYYFIQAKGKEQCELLKLNNT